MASDRRKTAPTAPLMLSSALPMDFPTSLQGGNAKYDPDADGSPKKKKVPVEFTSYGTTPSGKPRLFVCQVCTRAFARLEHLRRHERSHTKEKPFSCGVCQRKFLRRDLLLRHAQKLHAGCAEAITRLRKKSLKRSNSLGLAALDDAYDDDDDDDMLPEPVRDTQALANGNGHRKLLLAFDTVQFNLNLFSHQKRPRQNSLKDSPSLQRQVFDRKKLSRGRGASFSAQSGANYANALPEFNDAYPGAENVEFSTPQLLPLAMADENLWLSNLSTIPGMSEPQNGAQMRQDSVASISLDHPSHTVDVPSGVSHHGSFLGRLPSNAGLMRSDSVHSASSFGTFDSLNGLHYAVPTATVSNNELTPSSTNTSAVRVQKGDSDYGYSFYDVPEAMGAKPGQFKVPSSLSTIKQELDDEEMTDAPSITTNGTNFDLNFLYDIDELTHEFDVNSKFLPSGYLFYGDNPPLVSSSGIESTPPHTLPNHNLMMGDTISQSQLLNMDNSAYRPRKPSLKLGAYTRNKLFTSNMRYMVNKALSKYPISGIMTPSIPSNEKLEFYLNAFVAGFLSHFPFIHASKLNEYEIMSMTANEEVSNESARVCLPLLVATMGALLTNNKNDSEHLYEASRRTIHIYLESRKNLVNEKQPAQSVNPLWLIQSLTLSVMYGLFSDNENNVYIVIRQLNALNSLVKTSIKSNRTILFSINGDDEDFFNKIHQNAAHDSLFASKFNVNDEIKFKNNINVQSQVRIVFMIYRLTNFLLMMYNVPLTLSVNDLGSLRIMSANDEFLWSFKGFQAFQEYTQLNSHGERNLDYYLARPDNDVPFKDFLVGLSQNEATVDVLSLAASLSTFGFITTIHGIFEIKQYEEMKNMNVFHILDSLTALVNKPHGPLVKSRKENHEILDYGLLVNFVKICSLVDFKLVKEQSWLKNYDELTRNYNRFLVSMTNENTQNNLISDLEYLKVVDCCILIVKMILFRDDDDESDHSHDLFSHFTHNSSGYGGLAKDRSPADFCSNIDAANRLVIGDDIDNSKNTIHTQMIFHAFTILSVFSIYIIKRNSASTLSTNRDSDITQDLNKRYVVILAIMDKVEAFLKMKYQNSSNMDSDMASLFLYSQSNKVKSENQYDELMHDLSLSTNGNKNFSYSLEKSLYILKIGELALGYMYDKNVKVCIFKKLSGSLSQLRKFLIDNETSILA